MKPLNFKFNEPTGICLLTERLMIQTPTQEDAEGLHQYFSKNREYLKPFEPVRPDSFYSIENCNKLISEAGSQFKAETLFRFILKKNENPGTVIGTINFSNIARGPFQAMNVGYALDEFEQGKGLMNEGLSALIQYLFQDRNFHRIMANYLTWNTRSWKVLERLGFKTEGAAAAYLLIAGKWQDHTLTSKTNDNWKP